MTVGASLKPTEYLTETVTMAGAERMQTFNEWKISECGQFFHGCIVPVEKSKALEQVYEEPSLYDKLFGGPGATNLPANS